MQSTIPEARIPRSPAVKWRRIRADAIPLAVFVASLGACGWLWSGIGWSVSAIGKVATTRVDVTSPAAGMVVEMPNQAGGQLSIYEHVQAGQVIAVLEDQQQTPAKVIEVRAPISGTLIGIYCWPGQSVIPGGAIATIAADYGQHLVGYLPEESLLSVSPGMRVTLRPRSTVGKTFTSEVELVAKHVEPLPRHQWSVPTIPQWGIPVRIKMPPDVMLSPGSLVELRFDGASGQ